MKKPFEDQFIELKNSFILYEQTSVNINKDLAKYLIFNNATITKDGRVYHFELKHLGLGVYSCQLSNNSVTKLIK